MFGLFKSGMNEMRVKMFKEDFAVLRDHMSVDDQLRVYRLMRDDYHRIVSSAQTGASNLGEDAKRMVMKAMQDRNAASAQWEDKKNPDWMAASLIEHLCNAILSGDMKVFHQIYAPIGGWLSGMEMIDI